MSDPSMEFKTTPERAIISGEGLLEMDLSDFQGRVRDLGSIGISIERLYEQTGMNSNTVEKDLPIYPKHFALAAVYKEISISVATRAWNTVTFSWIKYKIALENQENDVKVPYRDREFLDKPWLGNICINKEIISYLGLKYVVENGLVENITNVGPKSAQVIEGVVESVKAKPQSVNPQ